MNRSYGSQLMWKWPSENAKIYSWRVEAGGGGWWRRTGAGLWGRLSACPYDRSLSRSTSSSPSSPRSSWLWGRFSACPYDRSLSRSTSSSSKYYPILPTSEWPTGWEFWVHQSSGLPTLIIATYFDTIWTCVANITFCHALWSSPYQK